ncbi:MAG: nucleoside-diphosphate-sugar epimerase [Granulosicoccus sp.]|jgi:nucleoside-diphosphate-sugar epimerase
MHTLILGAGYSGLRIALAARKYGSVCGTRRALSGVNELESLGVLGCQLEGVVTEQFLAELARATHLLICVAPRRETPFHDPMLSLLQHLTHKYLPALQWIGYLSTIGVYGNHEGRWVDEQTPCSSIQQRSLIRTEAEKQWQQFGKSRNLPVSVFRLSGIYGPGRNAVEDAITGRARILIKPHQVFNRIHVEDLAAAVLKAANIAYDGILNITDDVPAPPQDVIRYAHSLVGKPAPVAQNFATATISDMARSFYSENKRVLNTASKHALKLEYQYPNYRLALNELWKNK